MKYNCIIPFAFGLFITGCGTDPEIDFQQLISRQGVYYYASTNEVFSGTGIAKDRHGNVRGRYEFEDGLLDGSYSAWYEKGQLAVDGTYENGNREGVWSSWHENGSKYHVADYSEGVVDGLHEAYSEQGYILIRAVLKRGEPKKFERYYTTARLTSDETAIFDQEQYKNGQRHGVNTYTRYYNSNEPGLVYEKYECHFDDGALEEFSYFHYDSDGKLLKNISGDYDEADELGVRTVSSHCNPESNKVRSPTFFPEL